MKREPVYTWDAATGTATCTLTDNKNNTFVGKAHCHQEDSDMMSERTGYEIASRRAYITYLCHIRDNELKPALSALLELKSEIVHSTRFNKKSYESKSLYRKIVQKQEELDVIREEIKREKAFLKIYLSNKDNFYSAIRKKRNSDKND